MISSNLFNKKQLGLTKTSTLKMINVFLFSFTAEPQRTQRQVDFPLALKDINQRKRVQHADCKAIVFVSG